NRHTYESGSRLGPAAARRFGRDESARDPEVVEGRWLVSSARPRRPSPIQAPDETWPSDSLWQTKERDAAGNIEHHPEAGGPQIVRKQHETLRGRRGAGWQELRGLCTRSSGLCRYR